MDSLAEATQRCAALSDPRPLVSAVTLGSIMSDDLTDQTPAPLGRSAAEDTGWHLREVADGIRDAAAPLPPVLLRVLLTGVATIVQHLVERQAEASSPPPILFQDQLVPEAARMWELKIRTATFKAADRHRHNGLTADEPERRERS